MRTGGSCSSSTARPCGSELDVSGKILDREFAIEYDGELLAQISRRRLTVRDTYGVDLVREDADVPLLIAVAVCVTVLADREHDKERGEG